MDKTARLWSLADGTMVREFVGHQDGVTSVCVTPDGKHVITGSYDETARVWSLDDGAMVRAFEGHTERVTSVCTAVDGTQVVTGSEDKMVLGGWDDGA